MGKARLSIMTKSYTKSILHCLSAVPSVAVHGSDVSVSSLSYDSREILPGAAFFALPGIHTDGSVFIESAVAQGAAAVVHQNSLPVYREGVCYVQVPDVRAAMAAAAAAFFDEPSRELVTIGVTGTEGKTSTVDFIWQLLTLCGKKAGFSSTVSYSLGGAAIANPAHQTTPESVTVQERLARMRDNGCEYAVVESSSHGLSPRTARLLHVDFDAGVFMNVTQEHLEFHGTFEQYRYDKAHLFRALDTHDHGKKNGTIPAFGVVNRQDPSAEYFIRATQQPVFGFSVVKGAAGACTHGVLHGSTGEPANSGLPAAAVSVSAAACDLSTNSLSPAAAPLRNEAGGLCACNVREQDGALHFTVSGSMQGKAVSFEAVASVTGDFNVYNILAALITVHNLTGKPFDELVPLLWQLSPVKGRMCRVEEGQPFEVIIDYAHTPSSFQLIMPPISARVHAQGGKLIAVFGSGGERDTVKRPEQGRIAADYCDILILADEDPRGEDPVALLEMIAAGCPQKKRSEELFIIPNRPAAIRKAFSLAGAGDTVLLLGKGHENSIIGKDGAVPYDEYTEACRAIKELPLTPLYDKMKE
ncbi:MAG: UDP-N-acetylmuramyl-tripeptide synthetase [Treponema sp.]|uniref:UDP-N-acetylmuramyl-tripeptide synthetase n=1 Tax=Treponema sp. TaxID=166 RepID=UPI003FA339E6